MGVGRIISNTLTSQRGSIYVYCSLWPSVIQKALSICVGLKEKAKIASSVWLRPVNCITASCCSTEDDSISLAALIDGCKESELKVSLGYIELQAVQFIDRTWMEQQLFEAENAEEPTPSTMHQDTRHILSQHAVPGPYLQYCIWIIILGEVSQIGRLLHIHPPSFKAKAIKAT